MIERKPLANSASHRKPAKVKLLDAQGLCELNQIIAQLVDGIVARGNTRRAVAARVIAEYAERTQQVGHLRVPHAVVAAQRMR